MEGEVLEDCIWGDARWQWRWRQGEVEDVLPIHWDINHSLRFRYVEVIGRGDIRTVVLVLDFQKKKFTKFTHWQGFYITYANASLRFFINIASLPIYFAPTLLVVHYSHRYGGSTMSLKGKEMVVYR
jgi:hypothetical protein